MNRHSPLIAAQFVRPFVETNKAAIWEAVQRTDMRFVWQLQSRNAKETAMPNIEDRNVQFSPRILPIAPVKNQKV